MRVFNPVPPRFIKVGRQVIKCAETVYDRLGPGLLDSAYKSCLAVEMDIAALSFEMDMAVPLIYETVRIDQAMRLDFIVEEAVVVTVLATEAIRPIHEIRMRTHLKFSELRVGILLNFDVANFKQGYKKITV